MNIIEDIRQISKEVIREHDKTMSRNTYASIIEVDNLKREVNELKEEIKQLKENLYEVFFNEEKLQKENKTL